MKKKTDKKTRKTEEAIENEPKIKPVIESILQDMDMSFINLEDALSIGDAIDELGSYITACMWKLTERTMKGYKVSPDDDYKITTLQKQFKFIQGHYLSMVKSGRIPNNSKSADDANNDFLSRIKQRVSSIGAIVRDIPQD